MKHCLWFGEALWILDQRGWEVGVQTIDGSRRGGEIAEGDHRERTRASESSWCSFVTKARKQ